MRRLIAVCLLCLMLVVPLSAQDSILIPYEIALQRIEEAHESNATTLYLGGLKLTEVPPEIAQLHNLQVLWLSDNQLTALPIEMGQLSNLQILFLGSNQLTTLPAEIEQLESLQVLSLFDNRLEMLPTEIGGLNHLCLLELTGNNLQYLPTTIGNLRSLETNENCNGFTGGIFLGQNPLISPLSEVVEQGTAAVLVYLRNQARYHMQRLIIDAAGGVAMFALLMLGFRWKQGGGRKPKQKRG